MTAIPQDSPSWVRARIGYLTASRMRDAMSFTKAGKESADRAKLKMDIVSERLTDRATEHYVNPAMRWGLEQEEFARLEFSMRTGLIVRPAAFVEHLSIEFFGATPDGFVVFGDDAGLVEFKCPATPKHLGWLMDRVIPDEHKAQMLAQCACTGARQVHFVSYDPRVPEKQQMFHMIYEPTIYEIAEVEHAAVQFLAEVDAMFEKITEAV